MRFIGKVLTAIVLATSAAAAQPGPVYRPGRGVTLPEVTERVLAHHTSAALEQRIEGIVRLEAVVEADGTVGDVRVLSSLDTEYGLDEQAVDSVKRWTFQPGTYQGKPVPVSVIVEVRFSLR